MKLLPICVASFRPCASHLKGHTARSEAKADAAGAAARSSSSGGNNNHKTIVVAKRVWLRVVCKGTEVAWGLLSPLLARQLRGVKMSDDEAKCKKTQNMDARQVFCKTLDYRREQLFESGVDAMCTEWAALLETANGPGGKRTRTSSIASAACRCGSQLARRRGHHKEPPRLRRTTS